MPIKSYDPLPIAKEIINVFAKYSIPISFKDEVYKTVDSLLAQQTVQKIEKICTPEDIKPIGAGITMDDIYYNIPPAPL